MKTLLVLVAFLLALSPFALAEQPVEGEVRDASGKLVYNTTTRGNKTEVRSPSGKLLYKTKTKEGKTEGDLRREDCCVKRNSGISLNCRTPNE